MLPILLLVLLGLALHCEARGEGVWCLPGEHVCTDDTTLACDVPTHGCAYDSATKTLTCDGTLDFVGCVPPSATVNWSVVCGS